MQYSLFDEEDFLPQSPFTKRTVCVLGEFSQGKALVSKLLKLGAEVKNSLTRQVHFVLLGNGVGSEDIERLESMNFNGWVPRVLYQCDVDDIINGYGSNYYVDETITKHLQLSKSHWEKLRVGFQAEVNPLYTCEVYVSDLIQISYPQLVQQMGNHGIYANAYIDETTECLLLSDASVQHLIEGTTDEELQKIEQLYNNSRSQMFRFRLTCESDIRLFLEGFNS